MIPAIIAALTLAAVAVLCWAALRCDDNPNEEQARRAREETRYWSGE